MLHEKSALMQAYVVLKYRLTFFFLLALEAFDEVLYTIHRLSVSFTFWLLLNSNRMHAMFAIYKYSGNKKVVVL